MRIETLVATMNRKDASFLEQLNMCTDAVVINQTDTKNKFITKTSSGKKVLFISNTERGLSRSRNAALDNSTADICIVADDGFIHTESAEKIIEEAYQTYPDADIITFQAIRHGIRKKNFPVQPYRHNRLSVMKVSSCEITFRREAVNRVCVRFNEDFGTGSTFCHGEEHIFLSDCLKRGLVIRYVPVNIGTYADKQSTWFKGFDKKLFNDTGALYYVLGGFLWPVYNIQFAIRKHKMYKGSMSFVSALFNLFKGTMQYKKFKKNLKEQTK